MLPMLTPPFGSRRHFDVEAYTGWDVLLGALPRRWQAKIVARRLRRTWDGTIDSAMDGTFRLPGRRTVYDLTGTPI